MMTNSKKNPTRIEEIVN